MSRYKKFSYPNWSEYQKKIEADPLDAPRLVVEYYYNYCAIKELNGLREKAFSELNSEQRRAYQSCSKYGHKHYNTPAGRITLKYPYLKGAIKPQRTMMLLEQQQEKWRAETGSRYISGESVRDLSREETREGNTYSRESVDRIVDGVEEVWTEEFTNMDLKEKDYIDLIVDGTYDKLRQWDSPDAPYRPAVLLRAIGLSQESLEWEFLYEGVFESETLLAYQMLLDDLIDADIGNVYLATADLHHSIRGAVLTSLTGVAFQACRFHIEKGAIAKDREHAKILEAIFYHVYDCAKSRKEAGYYLSLFEEDLKQLEPSIHPFWKRHFDDSTVYLDYPPELAKEIASSNKLERNNEELRRRTDAIYAEASPQSLKNLAVGVTRPIASQWSGQSGGNTQTAALSQAIHYNQEAHLFREIDRTLQESCFWQYTGQRLGWKHPVALRINIWNLPMSIQEGVLTGALLSVHSIDRHKREQLIHLGQIKALKAPEVDSVIKAMLRRGLNTAALKLIIYNRPYRFLVAGVKTNFPEARAYVDANYVQERLLLLTPQEFREEVKERLQTVYQASDVEQAKSSLHDLKEYLKKSNLDYPLKWLNRFNGPALVSVLDLINGEIWKDYKISDFEIHPNWLRQVGNCVNKPVSVGQTIKAFIQSLKRQKTNKGLNN